MRHLFGQDRAIDILQAALRSGRMHHAWIFSGPPGVGKYSMARALAKIVLDPAAGPDLSGFWSEDPDSKSSRLIDGDAHPDLHVIRKELALYSDNAQLRGRKLRNIPLDVLRLSIVGGKTSDDKTREAPAYRTAAMGHGKVFIIDEAELIDQHGQNALLKTLEEPPPETYIVLVTAQPERLLPTIHSRCQHVRFGLLDDTSMTRWLDTADLELDGERLQWIRRFADGSPGRAMLAAEYGLDEWAVRLAPALRQLEHQSFPVELGALMAELVEEFATTWVKRHDNASKDAANKDGASHLLVILADHARQGLRQADGDEVRSERWIAVINLIREAERQLASNVNMKLTLENLAVQWTHVGQPVGV